MRRSVFLLKEKIDLVLFFSIYFLSAVLCAIIIEGQVKEMYLAFGMESAVV